MMNKTSNPKGWISVQDALPEFGISALVYIPKSESMAVMEFNEIDRDDFVDQNEFNKVANDHGEWIGFNEEGIGCYFATYDQVAFWMHLPEPPSNHQQFEQYGNARELGGAQ